MSTAAAQTSSAAAPAPVLRSPPRWLILLVFALVLAARLQYAWVLRYSIDADRGIVQLMASHMAEGRAWPVFFYGQAYMGSLEPMLGALFCLLFGTSAFAVALGTGITAFLLTLVVWRMARALAGPWAALYAAALFATVSPAFAAYMADPRGGYAMALLLGMLCLYLGARLGSRAFQREQVSWRWYALLGLAAGVAWWTSGIVAPALAAAALVIALGLRGRIVSLRIVAGLAGFLVGALPWLLWNAKREWISLSMGGSLGALPFAETLPLLVRRAWELLGLGQPTLSPYVMGGVLLLLPVLALVPPLRKAARARDPAVLFQILVLLLYLPLFIAAYASSTFARIDTLRYLLPLLPILFILLGLILGPLLARAPLPVHLVALALLVAAQPATGRYRLKTDAARQETNLRAPGAARTALEQKCDVAFVPYQMHWANFAAREAMPFVDPSDERYAPNARRALLAERPGWFAGANGIGTFLRAMGCRFQTTPANLDNLLHHVEPPDANWRLLPADQVARATGSDGIDLRPLLLDGNLATRWRKDSTQSQPASLELELATPTALCGLKFYSADANYPIYLAIDGRNAGETNWTELLPPTTATGYHWSGRAVYWRNLYHTLEARFAATPVSALRIRFPPSPRRDGYRFRLAELSLLAAETNDAPAAAAASPGDVDALVLRLQRAGIRRLLADRYVSDRVAARPGHAIEVRASAELSRELNDLPRRDTPPYTPCDLEPGIALLVPRGAAALTESRLRAARYHPVVEENALGTLLLLTAAGDDCVPQPGPMAWFGDALFAWQEEGQEARDAQRLYEQAQHLLAGQPAHPCTLPLLEEALTRFPDHLPALNAWLALAGPAHPLAGERQARLARLTQPARPCRVRFGNGLRLDGLTVTPTRAAPGSTLTITYYWRAPADVDYVGTATFVHFRQRHLIWQDDHEALAGVPRELIRLQPYEMPLLVERRITIPGDAPPGPYDLTLGLVAGAKGRRVPVRGPEAGLERSVHLSHVFEVTPP